MPFLYGNHVVKAHLGRITEDTPEHQGVVVFSMNDTPLVSIPPYLNLDHAFSSQRRALGLPPAQQLTRASLTPLPSLFSIKRAFQLSSCLIAPLTPLFRDIGEYLRDEVSGSVYLYAPWFSEKLTGNTVLTRYNISGFVGPCGQILGYITLTDTHALVSSLLLPPTSTSRRRSKIASVPILKCSESTYLSLTAWARCTSPFCFTFLLHSI